MAVTARRVITIIGTTLGVIAALIVIAYIAVVVISNRMLAATVTLPVTVDEIPIPDGNPEAIARGQYLVDHVIGCKDCHGDDFGGQAPVDSPALGTFWAPNLTAGEGSVTRGFTPSDWLRALRHGLGRDHRRLFLMPSADFVTFSDGDIASIIAYVKSMPPVDRPNRGIVLGPVGRVLVATHQITFAFDKIDHHEERPVATPGPTAEWGRVLAGTCSGCHGAGYSGGKIPGGDPAWPPARNLTPDATGLKTWTFDDFSNALRHGRRPDGAQVGAPMPWQAFAGMSDTDTHAIWAFLQTLPAKPAGNR